MINNLNFEYVKIKEINDIYINIYFIKIKIFKYFFLTLLNNIIYLI